MLFRDLSGNGAGVEIFPNMSALNITADATVPANTSYIRVGGAGNLIMRPAGGGADVTVAAVAGEYVPVDPGSVVRSTSTASNLHAVGTVA